MSLNTSIFYYIPGFTVNWLKGSVVLTKELSGETLLTCMKCEYKRRRVIIQLWFYMSPAVNNTVVTHGGLACFHSPLMTNCVGNT